ncbi:MAG: MFS transporter [Pseudomonadota bacterium]|nr:MFS transporter [Pseudomonadota bacterium]
MNPTPQRARLSANLVFFTYGLLIGTYLPYLPFIKDRFGVGEGLFSFGLFFAALGALLSLPLAPWILKMIGSRKAVLYSSTAFLLIVSVLIAAPDIRIFFVLFFMLGLSISSWEVSANSQASVIEDQLGKPVMSSIHGFWSLGTFVGSASMGGWLLLEIDGRWLVWLFGVLGLLGLIYVYQGLLRRHQIKAESGEESTPLRLRYLLYPPLLVIALFQIAGFMLEGSFQDWGAFLIRELVLGHGAEIVPERLWAELPADEAEARRRAAVAGALVLASFTGTMTIGRLLGDPFVARFGRVGTLQIGGALGVIGIALTTMGGLGWNTFVGFALVGLGTANVIPQVIKTADSTPGLPPGVAISAITAMGFVAFLGGPVALGFAGETYTFRTTFMVLGLLPVFILMAAAPVLGWFGQGQAPKQSSS